MNDKLSLSQLGVELIQHHESFSPVPYKDSGNLMTIGWGHLIGPNEHFTKITREEGDKLLREDVKEAEFIVKNIVQVELSQNQFDALVSFIYNTGADAFMKSITLRELNKGNYEVVEKRLPLYCHDVYYDENGQRHVKVLRGLLRRRNNEVALWAGKLTDKSQLL